MSEVVSPACATAKLAIGESRKAAEDAIVKNHYAHVFPSGKSHVFLFGTAIVVFSIPANKNIGRFLLKRECKCWELSRLWAPDGHEPNLLTRAISSAVRGFRTKEPLVEVLVSYADPNVGHSGGVYRAASWIYTGVSEESRYYRDRSGNVVSRRKFHSGSRCMTKAEIVSLGYTQEKMPGKIRFVLPLSRRVRKEVLAIWDHGLKTNRNGGDADE